MQTLNFNAGIAYAEYIQIKLSYITAAVVAFTMSSYFVVGYLAGDLSFVWNLSQWMNAAVGFGICGVMTAYQFILYSQGDVSGGKKATILAVCVAVGFSLLSEVGQGMERDHFRMETKSLKSPTFQTLLANVGQSSAPTAHPYSVHLQTAEIKLARCKENVANGVWSDCIESTARLATVKRMIQSYYHQSTSQTAGLVQAAKSMEKDPSNYHPLVNLIRTALSSTGVIASFILSLLLISFFEYAFHYLGRRLAAKRSDLFSHGFDVTRRTRKTPKVVNPDQSDLPLSEKACDSQPDMRDSQSAATPAATRDTPCTVHGQKPFTETLHNELAVLIKSRHIAPTFRPVKHQLKSWDVGTSDRNRQDIATIALDRMATDGILKPNPKKGGIKSAKYVLSDKYSEKVLGTSDTQLSVFKQGRAV